MPFAPSAPTGSCPPPREARRVAALHALDLIDSVPEPEYDAIAALTARLLDMPHAFITLMDSDRQWYKAWHNFAVNELPRSQSFCDRTVTGNAAIVVDDLRHDPQFATNALVTGKPWLRFYAGMPIRLTVETGESLAIGTLCVVDHQPRTLDAESLTAMRRLADLAEALVMARATALRAVRVAAIAEAQAADLERKDRIFREAERMALIGSWRLTIADETLRWSEGVHRIHGLPADHPPTLPAALDFYPPASRGRVSAALARTMQTGEPFDIEEDFIDALGKQRRVRARAELESVDGVPVALVGVFQDVTDHHALTMQLRLSADRDELTGIGNRAAFNRALSEAIASAQRSQGRLLLALVDLDGFKQINDTLGHLAGDDILRAIGRQLMAPWLRGSFAARLGGDEFALIVEDGRLASDPADFADRLQQELCLSVAVDGLTIAASGTVGCALLGRHDNVRDFVHAADTELYAAKRRRIGGRRRGDRTIAA